MTVVFMLVLAADYPPCNAGWPFFSKPAYRGKVIDAKTKAPIAGVVVAALYTKHTLIGLHGPDNKVIKKKEVLTDKKGEFHFPPYVTILGPNSREWRTEFIIYKPGYAVSYSEFNCGQTDFPYKKRISPPPCTSIKNEENYFLASNFGKEGEMEVRTDKIIDGMWEFIKQKVIFGLVELPHLKTRKQRLRAAEINPSILGADEDLPPLLFKTVNEERRRFGLRELK